MLSSLTRTLRQNLSLLGSAIFYFLSRYFLFLRFYVCNYGPGGNFVGRKMYQPGRACSACPGSSTCSSSYPGLCSPSSSVSPVFSSQISSRSISSTNTTSNIIPRGNVIRSKVSTRREPRLSDTRFSPRSGVVVGNNRQLLGNNRQLQTRPYRNIRPRNNRRPASSCRNILCTLARLFQ